MTGSSAKMAIITLVLATFLSGCITNRTQRGVSSNLVNYLYPEGQLISHQNDRLPVLNLPLKVGIAFIPESRRDYSFTLSEVEKQKLLSQVAARFKADKAILSIQIIPEVYLRQGRGFVTLSQVASLYDVDVMALVSYDQVAINELNNFSLAYWTIIGAYVIPGESTEFQTFVDTAVFDITTKKMLFRAPGIHSDHRLHTAVGFEKANRKMRSEGFSIASQKMTENLTKELDEFKRKVKGGEVAKVKYRKGFSSGNGGGGSVGWGGMLILILLLGFTKSKR